MMKVGDRKMTQERKWKWPRTEQRWENIRKEATGTEERRYND